MSSNAARISPDSYVFKAQQDKLMSKQPRHAAETKIVDGVQSHVTRILLASR